MNYCPNCGAPNTGNESYCAVCGRSLSASETPLVVLVKHPLTWKRKLAILTMLLLLASLILSFLPISYISTYYYHSTGRAYSTERSLIDSSNALVYLSLLTSFATIALLFLVALGKTAPQKAVFWTALPSMLFGYIGSAMIGAGYGGDEISGSSHSNDIMWGMFLILFLQIVSVVLAGVIQFKKGSTVSTL